MKSTVLLIKSNIEPHNQKHKTSHINSSIFMENMTLKLKIDKNDIVQIPFILMIQW